MINEENIEEYIKDKIGSAWFKNISKEQISYFIKWAIKCQCFRYSKEEERQLPGGADIGLCFKGYSLGLNYYNLWSI